MVNRAANKSERLLQIEALLLSNPEGLTQAEIARRLNVNRSTIYRYLPELEKSFSVYEDDEGKLYIDRQHYVTDVHFTLNEAMVVHLATRLMAQHSDKANPHAASAVRKLGISLDRLAPFISRHIAGAADVLDEAAMHRDPVYVQVLETLTEAWSLGRKVSLEYQKLDGSITRHVLASWYIEPYAFGHTSHVIGLSDRVSDQPLIFQIERIRTCELTTEHYTIPDNFDPRTYLASAWGIWPSEAEPVKVVLRFTGETAVRRVQATRWHHSQETEPQPDGSLIWCAAIAEPQEMLPWIRGWGADVEVLEPDYVRDAMRAESHRLAQRYGWDVHRTQPGESSSDESDDHNFFSDFFGG